jgi:very-short-patch-repair endonuclease
VGDPRERCVEDRRERAASERANEATGPASSSSNRAEKRRGHRAPEIRELFDLRQLNDAIHAHRGERGARALAAALEAHDPGTTLTKSELEELMLTLCDDHGLERPQVNETLAGLEVDFLFAARRLVVEADSWRFHRTRQAFERDRQRDAILTRAGYRTIRVTHRQITSRPSEVVATITAVGGGAAAPALRSSA